MVIKCGCDDDGDSGGFEQSFVSWGWAEKREKEEVHFIPTEKGVRTDMTKKKAACCTLHLF